MRQWGSGNVCEFAVDGWLKPIIVVWSGCAWSGLNQIGDLSIHSTIFNSVAGIGQTMKLMYMKFSP